MTLAQLEYIVAVAKEGNFHRAAKSCFVTQPTLSTLIKNLEEELEITIFDRSKKPIEPTRIGRLILEQAKTALLEARRIAELVEDERDGIRGELRIGVIPTIAPYLLPLFLFEFRKKYPEVDLSISEITTENCLKELVNDEIDLAILATKEDSTVFHQQHVYDEKMLFFGNRQHRLSKRKTVSIDDLQADEMWLLEEGHCLRDEIVKVCKLRKVENRRPLGLNLRIGNLESLRYLVQENFGYTLLPELATFRMPASEKKLLRAFSNPYPQRKVYFTTRKRHLRGSLINALRNEILNQTSKLLGSNDA